MSEATEAPRPPADATGVAESQPEPTTSPGSIVRSEKGGISRRQLLRGAVGLGVLGLLGKIAKGGGTESGAENVQAGDASTTVVTAPQAPQRQDQGPNFSEEEIRERSRVILEEHSPELLPLLENGPLPYYDKGIDSHTLKPYEVVSFVTETGPGLLNVDFLKNGLAKASTEHAFELMMQGTDLKHFPRIDNNGRTEVDPEVSKRIQGEFRDVQKTISIIVPAQINGVDTPWPWQVDENKSYEPMFTAETDYPIKDNTGVFRLKFHPDMVKFSNTFLRHHATGEPVNSGGPAG